jgi:hypothetical protein
MHIYAIGLNLWHCFWMAFLNLGTVIIYKMKNSWLEQYRLQKDEPWPWEVNREAWIKVLLKTIINVLFNNLVIVSVLIVIDLYLSGGELRFSFDVETIPDSPIHLFLTFLFLMLV